MTATDKVLEPQSSRTTSILLSAVLSATVVIVKIHIIKSRMLKGRYTCLMWILLSLVAALCFVHVLSQDQSNTGEIIV